MTGPADKAALRTEVLQRRAAVPFETRCRLAEGLARDGVGIARHGVGIARRGVGTETPVVSVFLSIRGEPDTMPLIEALVAAGMTVALPVTVERARPLRFQAWRPGDPLVTGRYGISEPVSSAREVSPDVLFVPLAAYDRRGFRLGYGAGYYDSSLGALRRSKTVVAVGVAFSIQEVEGVPTEPHDQRLDAVITEHGLMTFGSA